MSLTINPNEEFITKNYKKTIELIAKTFEDPNHPLLNMLKWEELGERYALSPASPKRDYHGSFPGGLCYHNLHVLNWLGKFAALLAPGKYTMRNLVTVGIFHDFGKIGDLEHEYYVRAPASDWHKKKGIFYETNREMQYMKIPHRSLYLAQHYYGEQGLSLSKDEYLAIMLHDGMYEESNRTYSFKEPDLAYILHQADYWAARLEKQHNVVGW